MGKRIVRRDILIVLALACVLVAIAVHLAGPSGAPGGPAYFARDGCMHFGPRVKTCGEDARASCRLQYELGRLRVGNGSWEACTDVGWKRAED